MSKNKTTVGEEAVKRLNNPDTQQGIIDTQREVDKEYFSEIEKCVEAHKSWDEPYYIVVHSKKERLLENVIRRYFIGRQSLPTPQWDQTVWRYYPKKGDLQFLWVLPDENTAMWMVSNPEEVPPEHVGLMQFIHNMLAGTLYQHFFNKFHKGENECVQLLESSYAQSTSQVAQATLHSV